MTPTGDELARFAAAVAARLGLRIDGARSAALLARRAAVHHEPVAAYLERAAGDAAELAALAHELTVGETYFLRHIEQFRAFASIVTLDRRARGPLRVLSAGCSSGEEPYSLAMLLRESCPGTAVAIHAIDINAGAIARAIAGRYSRWSLRATTVAFERRWFQPDAGAVMVVPEIRAAVTFEHANLLVDHALASAAQWDVVFCRNVVMYFTDDQAAALIARIAHALRPGGYLFLGHAETLRGRTEAFSLCHSHGAFYYQLRPVTAGTHLAPAPVEPSGSSAAPPDADWYGAIHAAARRVHAMVDGALDPAAARAPEPAATREPAAAPAELADLRALIEHERFGEALARIDQLQRERAGDRDLAMLRALALTHAGRFVEARAACDALLATDATSAEATYLLALCCDSIGDRHGAARLAQLAAELDPSFAMPRVHLGLAARRLGDRGIASRELSHAVALLEREAPTRLALYGGGFSRQALLGMCRAELVGIGAPP